LRRLSFLSTRFSTRFSALAEISVGLQCDGVEAAHSGGVKVLSPVLNFFRSEFTRAHTVEYTFAGVHFPSLLLAVTISLVGYRIEGDDVGDYRLAGDNASQFLWS
jgi:hypothetical protein